MSSDTNAMDQFHDFLRQRREASEPVENLKHFEQELHRRFVAAEREALGHELARFDLADTVSGGAWGAPCGDDLTVTLRFTDNCAGVDAGDSAAEKQALLRHGLQRLRAGCRPIYALLASCGDHSSLAVRFTQLL